MTDFAITGKKGSGKGLFSAGLIRDALRDGKKVATNMDIWPEKMLSSTSRATFFRLPDCPTVDDMNAIGLGNEIVDDSKNGIIVLDEASKFFNSRSWGDKTRQPLLDWLIHSRKLGWDVYYAMQGLEQVDKQLRSSQIEYHIAVKRTDKWPIPLVTPLCGIFGLNVRFPRLHLGIIKHGCDRDSLVVDRKFYRAKDIYEAYDTRQVFLDRDHPDATGLYSVLSPWHVKGRHLPPPPPFLLRFLYGVIGRDWEKPPVAPPLPKKVKHPLAAKLAKLPDEEALRHWRRLDALGAFEGSTGLQILAMNEAARWQDVKSGAFG